VDKSPVKVQVGKEVPELDAVDEMQYFDHSHDVSSGVVPKPIHVKGPALVSRDEFPK